MNASNHVPGGAQRRQKSWKANELERSLKLAADWIATARALTFDRRIRARLADLSRRLAALRSE